MRSLAVLSLLLISGLVLLPQQPKSDPRLARASRLAERNGWIQVHLEGAPAEIGYQHGYLLAREIEDFRNVVKLEFEHDEERPYSWFRETAREMFWPKIPAEYQAEMRGIAEGAAARGVKIDAEDITAINAFLEIGYYTRWLKARGEGPASRAPAERCSAFVATGSYTKDGRPVIGHNAWTNYLDGQRWNIVFDVKPASGHRFIMDGLPGVIHSGDDFGINAAGLAITETTISKFKGFDPSGVPEFARARRAMQYAATIEEFARIMREGNNGGYANNWLLAEMKTGRIASLELGLKNTPLLIKTDGYFAGSNFPTDPKLAREETDFNVQDESQSPNARQIRWKQVLERDKGKIDAAAGQRFLADHYDAYAKKEDPNERTLCGHIDLSPRGIADWQPPFGIAGAVQNKAADASLAGKLSFSAAMGHACGLHFKAAAHLEKHPDMAWQRGLLRDLPARPWTVFAAR